MNGFGKESFTDGSVYEGEYADGLKHGKGKITWANSSY